MSRPAAVILDVDGTLVDSNDAHARAWVDAFAEAGLHPGYERVRRAIGMGGDKLVPALTGLGVDGAESKEAERLRDRRAEIFRERELAQIRPFPRVPELLARMRAEGLSIVVASSAREEELAPLLGKAGAPELANNATSSDDAEHSKPDPDIVAAALEKLGGDAGAAVMIGDTPYDVEAATRAGVATIALRTGGWSDAELRGAAAIYDDPADLLARFDDSILAGRAPR